jgi:hypothetical protein
MTVDDKWSVHQVIVEFKKANNGNTPDRKMMSGCLNDLTDSSLLKRTGTDIYSKSPVRKVAAPKDMIAKVADPVAVTARATTAAKPAAKLHAPVVQPTPVPKEVVPMSKPQVAVAKAVKDPLDMMAEIAAEAVKAGKIMINMADNLENVMQELKLEREKSKAYADKIKRLDALLLEFKS